MKKLSLWNELNTIGLLDPALKHPRNIIIYIRQSLLAFIFLLVFLLFWTGNDMPLSYQVIFAAIGSSTFLVFSSPSRYTSKPRPIIAGHAIGIMIGIIIWHLHHSWLPGTLTDQGFMIFAIASSVALATLFMTIFNAEHPPAAGTALAFAVYEIEPNLYGILFVMLCALSLALIREIFWKRKWLKDLL